MRIATTITLTVLLFPAIAGANQNVKKAEQLAGRFINLESSERLTETEVWEQYEIPGKLYKLGETGQRMIFALPMSASASVDKGHNYYMWKSIVNIPYIGSKLLMRYHGRDIVKTLDMNGPSLKAAVIKSLQAQKDSGSKELLKLIQESSR